MSSKPTTIKTITDGIKNNTVPTLKNIVQLKPAKIFIKVWPDIILANSRVDKLTTRAQYESNSTIDKNGDIGSGAPGGKLMPAKRTL